MAESEKRVVCASCLPFFRDNVREAIGAAQKGDLKMARIRIAAARCAADHDHEMHAVLGIESRSGHLTTVNLGRLDEIQRRLPLKVQG